MVRSSLIHWALTSSLLTLAQGLSVPVVLEGAVSEPPQRPYLREWLLLSPAAKAALGQKAAVTAISTYQIGIVTDLAGWGQAYELADEISSKFKIGSELYGLDTPPSKVRIIFNETQVGPALRDGDRFLLPVSIRFRFYAAP